MKRKLNIVMIILFISIIIIASDRGGDNTNVIGCTELNGDGCVCHSFERDTDVAVWVEGPDTLVVGQTGLYKMFLTGGPAEAGGYNVAGRFGTMEIVDTLSFRHPLEVNELTQSFPLLFPSSSDTIYWEFEYTASASSPTDTIYSCGLSLVYDSIPDFHDRWNFGPKFPINILPSVTGLPNENDQLVIPYVLNQNYPNPFNPVTKIRYSIPQSSKVEIKIFDISGQEIATLVDEKKSIGSYEIIWNAQSLPSGIYFYKLIAGNYFTETKKMILLK
ncbi:MAG: T9SS type A sorting domain-containing protein [Ignavibacteriaceae bacterium]|jgi:hypothetical protein